MLLCALFSVAAVKKVWPPLDGDAPAYFPAAVEISEGRPPKTPVWLSPFPSTLELFKENRFVGHGFVYPMAVGGIGWLFGGGARATVAGMYLVNLAATYLVGRGLLLWAPETLRRSIWCGVVFGISVFSFCLAWAGRMEPGVFFLVGLALMVAKPDTKRSWLLLGGITACLGLISPVYGVGGMLLLGVWYCLRKKAPSIQELLCATMGMGAVVFIAFWIYPYPFQDWFQGVLQSRSGATGQALWWGFVPTWIRNLNAPGLIFLVGLGVIGSCRTLLRLITANPEKVLGLKSAAVFCALLFALFIFRMAVAKSEAAYNAIGWIPLFLAAIFHATPPRWMVLALIGGLLLSSSALIRSTLILIHQYRGESVKFEELREEIAKRAEQGVLVSPAFFLACPDPWKVEFDDMREKQGARPPWLVKQQFNSGLASPPEIPGYLLEKNRFGPGIKIFGFPISRTPGGWEYAVYQRL